MQSLEKFVEELSALIRSRYPLICLNSYEEVRSLEVLASLDKQRDCNLYIWSRTQGVMKEGTSASDAKDPMAVLRWFEELREKALLVVKDFHPYLKDPGIQRKLRDLGQILKRSQKNLLFLSPNLPVPPDLVKEITVLDVPLPSKKEIEGLIQKAAAVLSDPGQKGEPNLEDLTDAACGLTYDEIENVLAKSIVSQGSLDRKLIQHEKRQIVKKSGLLEFLEPDKVTDVGGLIHLRSWLDSRKRGLSQEAREINLPVPKGILLVGIPGCGKSLTAMTVGKKWGLPLLRLDMGKVFSGLVGSSEGNIRSAISTCEAVSPCILWIDEIEKGLSGTGSSGQSDGGTTSRVFGTILTWMQEKTSSVFVVATANDISKLPPEFLRKGRFDEIFFVDLPSPEERGEIFKIHQSRFQWDISDINLPKLVEKTDGFSGSEIEQVLVSARYLAFSEEKPLHQSHVMQAITETVPLSKTMGDRLDSLRDWAKHRARAASKVTLPQVGNRFEFRNRAIGKESNS